MIDGHWLPVGEADPRAHALYRRHYSAHRNGPAMGQWRFGPGEKMVLLTLDCDALFVWRLERLRADGQDGVYCQVFRNEGPVLASELIAEADELAWARWPAERRHFTFVDAGKVRRKRDPGRCFAKAGWSRCGTSGAGLLVFERVVPAALKEAA